VPRVLTDAKAHERPAGAAAEIARARGEADNRRRAIAATGREGA
jgi:hypothetical protein